MLTILNGMTCEASNSEHSFVAISVELKTGWSGSHWVRHDGIEERVLGPTQVLLLNPPEPPTIEPDPPSGSLVRR